MSIKKTKTSKSKNSNKSKKTKKTKKGSITKTKNTKPHSKSNKINSNSKEESSKDLTIPSLINGKIRQLTYIIYNKKPYGYFYSLHDCYIRCYHCCNDDCWV